MAPRKAWLSRYARPPSLRFCSVFPGELQQSDETKSVRIAEVASDDWVWISLWARHSLGSRHTTGRARHEMPGTGTESSLVSEILNWTKSWPTIASPHCNVFDVLCSNTFHFPKMLQTTARVEDIASYRIPSQSYRDLCELLQAIPKLAQCWKLSQSIAS